MEYGDFLRRCIYKFYGELQMLRKGVNALEKDLKDFLENEVKKDYIEMKKKNDAFFGEPFPQYCKRYCDGYGLRRIVERIDDGKKEVCLYDFCPHYKSVAAVLEKVYQLARLKKHEEVMRYKRKIAKKG